ncbi:GNAT family N-acetyltransferase [Roseomonas sp. KE2513]|uniref:bifunctional helix-turn-helix transcriptional regulator/GNAT family N-acetyltransferase n=1 Tax=Roseomonas sp. KE2513 TaxID=2479202 RepID=UPI0018DFA57A|nr:bifunctional helix-turn-helix transcriptional regulator/GNAT family N-acetyltransferase [Roseomonas sp. KE2513]MBI0535760.1 GNAT family N-acetyltransferase [Roseomonas sp. KE2513]
MRGEGFESCVAAVRRFSRFYTRRIGLLHEGLLRGPLSLAEGRLVYELAQRETCTARDLGVKLDLDSGYLSRLLRGLEERGLIGRRPAERDGRQLLLSLTTTGREAFAAIDARSRDEIGALLDRLSLAERRQLASALAEAERLLSGTPPEPARAAPYLLRPPRPGDMGWIVHRQAVIYTEEYGWDATFEALVAEIVATFIREFDPRRERCWLAERDGVVVGSVFLVRASEEVAKLRLLYVEPSARGLGMGRRLVEECIRSARELGYRRLTLWTNDILVSARRIYLAAGFRLSAEERHHSFGKDLVGQNWELDL